MAKNDFRVTSVFKIILGICMKNVGFCVKTSNFLPERCKNVENEIMKYLTPPHTHTHTHTHTHAHRERERERKSKRERRKNIIKNINSKTPEKLSLVIPVTNYLIITNYHFYHLWSDPGENLKNKNWS